MRLMEILRLRQVGQLIADAEFIRDQRVSEERLEAAKRHIRSVMYEVTVGRFSHIETAVVFSILDFAVREMTHGEEGKVGDSGSRAEVCREAVPVLQQGGEDG